MVRLLYKIANPSMNVATLPTGLCHGHLFTVNIVSPDQLHVSAIANTPKSVYEPRHARAEVEGPLSKALTYTTLTLDQQSGVLDLCAKFRPIFCCCLWKR